MGRDGVGPPGDETADGPALNQLECRNRRGLSTGTGGLCPSPTHTGGPSRPSDPRTGGQNGSIVTRDGHRPQEPRRAGARAPRAVARHPRQTPRRSARPWQREGRPRPASGSGSRAGVGALLETSACRCLRKEIPLFHVLTTDRTREQRSKVKQSVYLAGCAP